MIRTPAQPNAGTTELTLMVEFAEDADDTLLRILSTLHRRRCHVTAAEFGAFPGRLALQIRAPAGQADRVAQWLNSLVDVRQVQTALAGSRACRGPVPGAPAG